MAKILIIDDDAIVRDALMVFLTRSGHDVEIAADGVNGLIVFKSCLPDLVILDRDLPGLSGSEVMSGILAIGRKTQIVILTGYDNIEDADQYLNSGATAFLSKSDGLSNVLTEIDRLLGAARQQTAGPGYERAPAAEPSAPETGRILVADDDDDVRTMLCRFLVSQGYAVFSAADGEAALSAVEKQIPDLVLLDITMPAKNGVEVLKVLSEKRPGIGILMITGNEDEETARVCLRNGAFDYITKPVNLDSLATIVKARLLVQQKQRT